MSTLKLVGVSHLFVVPRIRSSAYVRMLCDAFPALANSHPGDIQEAALPALKHLVVVDNTGEFKQFERELEGVRPAVDFREVMVWREDTAERRRVGDIMAGLEVDDVINLQFTRCVRRCEWGNCRPHYDAVNSGTTGAPKAVSVSGQPTSTSATNVHCYRASQLTHHNLLNNGISIGRCMHLTPSDKLCTSSWPFVPFKFVTLT